MVLIFVYYTVELSIYQTIKGFLMSKNMNKVGIIAEYNPFTNGHKYQLDYAKSVLNADCVIIAMSGSFCQRGEVCIFDKYTRANCALVNGADIVLEIPVYYSTSSASDFAEGAVRLLHKAGINTLLFGVESGDETDFINTAKKLIEIENSPEFIQKLNTSQKAGSSFAASYYDIASELLSINKDFFLNSNNILGIEYCKAIIRNQFDISIKCIHRVGSNYNDFSADTCYSSASAVRNIIKDTSSNATNKTSDSLSKYLPANTLNTIDNSSPIFANDISEVLHYALLTNQSFDSFLDCSENISNTIKNQLNNYVDFNSFAEIISSKILSVSRAKRILCHILLNIKTDDVDTQKSLGFITYIRILGFTKNGSQYLKEIKDSSNIPLISSPSEFKESDICFDADIHSADIYRMLITKKTGESLKTEFTRKNSLINL